MEQIILTIGFAGPGLQPSPKRVGFYWNKRGQARIKSGPNSELIGVKVKLILTNPCSLCYKPRD